MEFQEAIKTCFKKYATFKGCATRSEFWWFYLFLCILGSVCGFIWVAWFMYQAFNGTVDFSSQDYITSTEYIQSILVLYAIMAVVWIPTLIPFLAVSSRRLHDSNLSAWNILWGIIPYVGTVVMIVLMCRKTREDSKYKL